jgi:hypothetical protein
VSVDARCRSCGALIVWALTEEGRRLPLDSYPHAGGNLALDADGVRVRVADLRTDEVRYQSHFATCPQAKTWRKP